MQRSHSSKYFDVFLSYRRDGGSAFAALLQRELSRSGLTVFLDTKTIESGEFDSKIKVSIENSANFVFLLTPGSLKRCFDRTARDFVLEEIQLAYSIRQKLVNQVGKEHANNTFRIVPVFLGEELNAYSGLKADNEDAWNLLNSMFGDAGHNGVKLADANSFDSELTKLTDRMLLKPSGRFVSALIDRCVADDDGLRQSLEELFSCYLDMYAEHEYSNIRALLSPLVHDRLLDILGFNDSDKLTTALNSFRLKNIKGASSEVIDPIECLGSRARVVSNLDKWLRGEKHSKPHVTTSSAVPEYRDRLVLIKECFVSAILKRKWMDREKLVNAIMESIENDDRFFKFQPENWKRVSAIADELFEHFSYADICWFLRKKLLSKAEHTEMQRHIWSCIQSEYKNISGHRENAAWGTYAQAIETFMRYEAPYPVGQHDLVSNESDSAFDEPLGGAPSESPFDRLIESLRKIMRGNTRAYRSLVADFLLDSDIPVDRKNFTLSLASALRHRQGEFLHELSNLGLSRDVRFQRGDWKLICSAIDIPCIGNQVRLVLSIRSHVFGLIEQTEVDNLEKIDEVIFQESSTIEMESN